MERQRLNGRRQWRETKRIPLLSPSERKSVPNLLLSATVGLASSQKMSQRQDPRAARLTADAARKKRETEAVQLRNRHREEMMVKRRNLDADIEATPVADVQAAVRSF